MLDKNSNNPLIDTELYIEQRNLLSSNGEFFVNPSFDLEFEEARQRLLDRGMSEEEFEGLMGFLRGLAKQFIDEELRTTTSRITNNEHDN